MYRFLAVIIGFVGILGMCSGTEGESRAVVTRDYGVKLCGREFIRAVIFTCGGSRWKRSGPVNSLQSSSGNPYQLSLNGHLSESQDRPIRLQSALIVLEQLQKPTASLADLLKELGDSRDYETDPGQGERPEWESKWKRVPAMTLGTNSEVPWPRPYRQKRNFSLGLAGMCCNQGCTKNDIGRLC